MRFRTSWPVVAVALGGLVLLIAAALFATSRRTSLIYGQFERLSEESSRVQTRLHEIRSNVLLTGLLFRDFLLNPSPERDVEIRAELARVRARHGTALAELKAHVGPESGARLSTLATRLDSYWNGLAPVFGWPVERRRQEGAALLDLSARTTREAVIAIVEEVEGLNRENTTRQRAIIATGERELREYLRTVFWVSTSLGLIVAIAATVRLSALEHHTERQRLVALQAEQDMRQLSLRLVETQESERKALSRELHDHVSQILTALRMELGRAERTRALPTVFAGAITEAKQLTETIMRTVRDIAMGLRPSMLDDLGLGPALEWYVRDFTRRSSIPVTLTISGNVDRLPDAHRTCAYRVIQEALTNCARHAKATRVSVTMKLDEHGLTFGIADNGIGVSPGMARHGLGLVGVDERVRELDGTVTVESTPGGGTTIRVSIPPPPLSDNEEHLAHLAG
jgi:signal transduction histidine kinase